MFYFVDLLRSLQATVAMWDVDGLCTLWHKQLFADAVNFGSSVEFVRILMSPALLDMSVWRKSAQWIVHKSLNNRTSYYLTD